MEGNGKLLRARYQLNTLVLQLNIQIGRERTGTVNLSHNEICAAVLTCSSHPKSLYTHLKLLLAL